MIHPPASVGLVAGESLGALIAAVISIAWFARSSKPGNSAQLTLAIVTLAEAIQRRRRAGEDVVVATIAALCLIFLFCLVCLAYRQAVLARRENQEAMAALWAEAERAKRAAWWAGLNADSALYAAQRAEDSSIAARVLVTDNTPPPTRKA